jgi:CDP-diacylglycerol--serine O-phosphatidyltransferase
MFKLPNIITLINLLCGCLAVLFLFRHNIEAVLLCIGCSLLADFLDGFVARLLNSYSDMGKELDSLADMVSFGFLPGCIMFYMLQDGKLETIKIFALVGFVVTLFAALRLAKFNIDTRQSDTFMGMPTPSATLLISGLLWLFNQNMAAPLFQTYILIIIAIAVSILMVIDIPMFSLKFKGFSWKGNEIRYIFIIFAVLTFVLAWNYALPIIISVYTLYSILAFFIKKI